MILVTGGAGYIGSHVVKLLLDSNFEVLVIDNLSTGFKKAVDNRAIFVEADLGNKEELDKMFIKFNITGVIHFAASAYVGESVLKPQKYYKNNVITTINLLEAMLSHKVEKIIFSSSCAVYGNPTGQVIIETEKNNPINPYGHTKLICEKILENYSRAYNLTYINLRYFNVAGGHPTGVIGEYHNPETHLIPRVLEHLLGKYKDIRIFGNDYPTKDGTCIRDYIHVMDLAEAHKLALVALLKNHTINEVFNLGIGKGYSVKEVISKCEEVSGIKANIRYENRRIGDPAMLVASADKAKNELGWVPKYDINHMVSSAWKWHQNNPNGYTT
ncbi:UDP-glucose 4-epimerase GalE [Sutcliffiella horikoshii]|uniref:UDP-glucose 4-epimerase GalE n=1 Tax=Sutcliffiella horikoshii TaxID=79883 RepID=UPI001EEEDE82|nr:UDP-glucose 4-epimerase GalE [Sutcliffiella horikoshii]MCG1020146.1 UDP-glucose 4-epimerase GalE [Sutcliffiella horikoshii]